MRKYWFLFVVAAIMVIAAVVFFRPIGPNNLKTGVYRITAQTPFKGGYDLVLVPISAKQPEAVKAMLSTALIGKDPNANCPAIGDSFPIRVLEKEVITTEVIGRNMDGYLFVTKDKQGKKISFLMPKSSIPHMGQEIRS